MGQHYVCGFCFDSPVGNIALIKKNRGPANMAGKLNGIGGKIETTFYESNRAAMSREFLEETGVYVPNMEWQQFHVERYFAGKEGGAVVFFFAAKSRDFHLIRSVTDEHVILMNAHNPDPGYEYMYNLSYLIPMAQNWLTRPLDRYFEG